MGGYKAQFSKSRDKESQLSLAQTSILKNREKLFRREFLPLFSQLQADVEAIGTSQDLQQRSVDVQRAAQKATGNLQRGLARRGLGESGLAVTGQAAIEAAQLRGLAAIRPQADEQQFQRRAGLAQMAQQLAPQTTTQATNPVPNQEDKGRWVGTS